MTVEIANRLCAYRKQHRLSQEELAAKLGVSRQAVSKWERAEASPDTDNLIALAEIYGVTLDELIHGSAADAADTVSFRKGIHIHSKEGHQVDVGFNGVHVESPQDGVRVHIDPHRVFVQEEENCAAQRNKQGAAHAFYAFPYPVLCVVLYLLCGFFHICGGWAFGWLIFLTIPLYYSLVSAVVNRNPHHFAYPVLVTVIYLYGGCFHALWHPLWIIFFTVPLYYSLCDVIRQK